MIRAWADTLRRGDVEGAAEYFAVPATVSNGTPPLKLKSRAEVEFFNRTLPCGAQVIATEDAPHGFVIATFRLTERPGKGRCGTAPARPRAPRCWCATATSRTGSGSPTAAPPGTRRLTPA